ncbi:MAG TPA: HAD-IA family hydrolase [Phycisphaerae bacterium]|nr:HAD-IA family hydrolase [Phycisphaerae bacterium]
MYRYDAVFFDSGGTLFDPSARNPSMQEVIDQRIDRLVAALGVFGIDAEPSRLEQAHETLYEPMERELGPRFSYYLFLLRVVDQLGLPLSAEQTAIVTVAYAGPRYRHWVFPDTHKLLAQLTDAGIRLGLIANTAWPGFAMHTALAGVGLARYFDFMVISCDEGVAKPDPAIFRVARRRAGLTDTARVLYVGDDIEKDIRGAKDAGWDAALRRSSAPTSEGLADFEFDHSLEVLPFIFG